MNFPTDLKYTDSHEWVRQEADGTLTVGGISDAAQDMLGDLVFWRRQGWRIAHQGRHRLRGGK